MEAGPALTPGLLLRGYRRGIFPMAEGRESRVVFWVEPRRRGVLPLEGFHISRSLARHLRRTPHRAVLNGAFGEVLSACAARDETWINAEIHDIYLALHHTGHAHSLEIRQDGDLAGGVFGVAMGGAFFGESMFSLRLNGSKMALAYLTCHLVRSGFALFDTQFITPHLATLGAVEISRAAYRRNLDAALAREADITATPLPALQDVLQRSTQTS